MLKRTDSAKEAKFAKAIQTKFINHSVGTKELKPYELTQLGLQLYDYYERLLKQLEDAKT